MKKIHFLTVFLLFVAFVKAGCQQEPPRENAPIISQTPALVSLEEANQAEDEIYENKLGAMPCLQFKYSEGFLKWLEAYRTADSEAALKMARGISLPDNPEPQMVEALKMSQTEGALQTSLCNVHKGLGIFTWAVEFADETNIYTYRKPDYKKLNVAIKANTDASQIYSSSTDLTQLALPSCLPKTITPSELIWFCGTPYENWKEVHVNRKLGNMKQISCEIKKGDETVKPGLGCLDPSAAN
ncbi:MAG: hypothetical protein P1P90_01705 [Patescibacteria group bacterium]|nr:hypothetical protein [Patescibacteria group bacterium]